jgi:hypothetical protein
MPVITERFQTLPIYDKGTNSFALIHQPKVTIFIKVHGQLYPYTIEAFVDSGATRNLFPADVLTSLQIPVDNGQKKIHHGIGGITVASYTHNADILIGGHTIRTEIDFSLDHKPALLGIDSFFEFFDSVNFNMERSQLELRYSTKKN